MVFPLRRWQHTIFLTLMILLAGCTDSPWNDPYPASEEFSNILYTSFSERPKHLDPARSYSSNEYELIAQIYEPPLQYHYLLRPYTLIPATASEMPRVKYLDEHGRELPANASVDKIAESVYDINVKAGIDYQPHPAFARDDQGHFLYDHLTQDQLDRINTMDDFPVTGTRELVAADYVYQIKRLADPRLHSPIFGIMSSYIIGLADYQKTLKQAYEKAEGDQPVYLDLNQYPLEGVQVVSRYVFRIRIHGKYPQLLYWMAVPFFAPLPHEVDRFYAQPGLTAKNITLDWYPVGTGPYMLTVNNPNRQMILTRNPNFHGENYPVKGDPGDRDLGLLADAGKPLPFIDKVVYSLEKENIPYWNKFLQGYYDVSGVTSDSFDQAISMSSQGELTLTDDMRAKGMHLSTAIGTSTFYTGFNMLDPVIGGYSERSAKLRRAIAIAVDEEEYISIFLNGRGLPAQGPLPPGIFGYVGGEAGHNPYVYDWINDKPVRKSLEEAKRLLAEAGYPDGRDVKTGEPLLLNLDTAASGPDAKAQLDWWRKQFRKLNIQLNIRSTDYNRFQDKMNNGTEQIFQWGWNADYPDPENFLFLLYGRNKKVGHQGENAANYDNPQFNTLFEKMKNMDNTAERQSIINQMVDIARKDSPWLWGLHPKGLSLYHDWYHNSKPHLMANNTMKYKRIDPVLRAQKRLEWNKPVVWPLYLAGALLIAILLPGIINYRRRERQARPN
jgi:peptide/nickel transport system substrate-binding protein